METKNIKKIYELLNKIPVTKENEKTVEEIKECLLNGDFITALEKLKEIQMENNQKEEEKEQEEMVGIYPKRLSNTVL